MTTITAKTILRSRNAMRPEHVAQADEWVRGIYDSGWIHPKQHANFVGFRQYRHML